MDTLKPIFHCDAKYLASGVGVGQCLRRQNFALGIPTCWSQHKSLFPDAKLEISLALTQSPNASQWNIGCLGSPMQKSCVGHVHVMFLFYFICVWYPTQTQFLVEYGLDCISKMINVTFSFGLLQGVSISEDRLDNHTVKTSLKINYENITEWDFPDVVTLAARNIRGDNFLVFFVKKAPITTTKSPVSGVSSLSLNGGALLLILVSANFFGY